MATAKSLVDGLPEQDQAALHAMSKEALQVEEQRLALLLARRGQAIPDRDLLRRARVADAMGTMAATDRRLAVETRDRPELAKALQEIRVLARDPNNPKNAEELREVLSTLNESAARYARTVEMEARSKDPNSAEAVAAKERRKQAEVEAITRSRAVDPPNLANEIEGEGVNAALATKPNPKAVPAEVAERYVQDGKGFHPKARPSEVAFVDHGSRLQTNQSFDGDAVKSMVSIAEARGWESMKVSGSEAFRRAVWFEAATRGIAVVGYKPSEAEQLAATSAAERNGKLNRLEANPAVKAFLAAETGTDRVAAAKLHPELKNAFAHQEALRRFADARMPQAMREGFMARQRENIARDIGRGVVFPTVELRERKARAKEAHQER